MNDTKSLPTYPVRTFVKQILVLFAIISALGPPVYAEGDKWIDGIKLRYGYHANVSAFELPENSPINPHLDDDKVLMSSNTGRYTIPMFPVNISLPETLMTSWSYRGAVFEFVNNTVAKDLPPVIDTEKEDLDYDDSKMLRQKKTLRTKLYNEFFNSSDRSFADTNPNWALSADVSSSNIFIGYNWGVFLPWGNNRFWKLGLGSGLYYWQIAYNLNLCSQYKGGQNDGECDGKSEIDSASASLYGLALVYSWTLWERVTKDSKWIFVGITQAQNLTRTANSLKLKNHDKNLEAVAISGTYELISYTYRF